MWCEYLNTLFTFPLQKVIFPIQSALISITLSEVPFRSTVFNKEFEINNSVIVFGTFGTTNTPLESITRGSTISGQENTSNNLFFSIFLVLILICPILKIILFEDIGLIYKIDPM